MTDCPNRISLNFYSVISSTLISQFGSFLNMMAINILILELTNSALWVGLVLGVRIVSGMLLSPYLGFLSDRWNRKHLMIFSDIILAISVFLLVLVPGQFIKLYIIILMTLIGIFSSLFDICIKAAIPHMLGSKDTLKANSLLMGGRNFMIGLSALCAVFAHILFENFTMIFVMDAITYIISAIVLFAVPLKTSQSDGKTHVEEEGLKALPWYKKLQKEYAGVWRLKNISVILLILVILFFDAFASASHNVGWPVLSKSFSSERPMFLYGVILFAWAIGNIMGIYLLNKIKILKQLPPERLYLVFTIVMSLGMIFTFISYSLLVISLAAFIAGIGDGTYQTYFTT
ncbi:MFS transporter, partial [bacterium]|nr:MFS transporter [bacterium]MBU1916559.1 MFS transporter [bacterium]